MQSRTCFDKMLMQDTKGLEVLHSAFFYKKALRTVKGIVIQYVTTVCKQRHKVQVGAEIVKALRDLTKNRTREFKRKICPPVEIWILAWAKKMEDRGQLEDLLGPEPWSQKPDGPFFTGLRALFEFLATPSATENAKRFRERVHQGLVHLACTEQTAKVR